MFQSVCVFKSVPCGCIWLAIIFIFFLQEEIIFTGLAVKADLGDGEVAREAIVGIVWPERDHADGAIFKGDVLDLPLAVCWERFRVEGLVVLNVSPHCQLDI